MKLFGITGWSGSGKTTLITRLIKDFSSLGIRVSTIKHAHHNFECDVPGKDSWQHRHSGASEVIVASEKRMALIHEYANSQQKPYSLVDLVKRLALVEMVLIEGFKNENHPRMEIWHNECRQPPVCLSANNANNIVLFATDNLENMPTQIHQAISERQIPICVRDDLITIKNAINQHALEANEIFS